jgi:hypothetical protein
MERMHPLGTHRARLALALACGLGLAGGFVLGALDTPTEWYYGMGAALVAIGTLQALRPGAGLPLPSWAGVRSSEGHVESAPEPTESPTHTDRHEFQSEYLPAGYLVGSGVFQCEACGHRITIAHADALPKCPRCDGLSFTRTSMFDTAARPKPLEPIGPPRCDTLLDAARESLESPGRYLMFREGETIRTVPIEASAMRIGRTMSADLRIEDPTVSTRHAMLLVEHDCVRVLDDRSLNGVFVNGERVVAQQLQDGDEIVIGRFPIRFVDVTQGSTSGPGSHRTRSESAASRGSATTRSSGTPEKTDR